MEGDFSIGLRCRGIAVAKCKLYIGKIEYNSLIIMFIYYIIYLFYYMIM